MTIKAIETRYAGCRFRSRLEARWAIALTTLGIEWEYEAQGFECHSRISLSGDEWRYLPDFWLPKEHCYLEVKGELTEEQMLRVIDNAGSLCNRNDTRLILAGPIPDPERNYPPTALSMRKGCLLASPGLIGGATEDGQWEWESGCVMGRTCVAHDVGGDLRAVVRDACHHNSGGTGISSWAMNPFGRPLLWKGYRSSDLYDAYAAARSARFEHGERGVA